MICFYCWLGGGDGCNSAGLSRTPGASSVSCLVLESLFYLDQTDCFQFQILQHMHYLMASTVGHVVLRFTTTTWVTGELLPMLMFSLVWQVGLGMPASLTSLSCQSTREELVVRSKSNVPKKEGRGEIFLFRCVRSFFPISSVNTYLGALEEFCYSLDRPVYWQFCDVTVTVKAAVKHV